MSGAISAVALAGGAAGAAGLAGASTATALAVGGGALAAESSISRGYAQAAADKANATIAQQNAVSSAQQGEAQAGQSELQNRVVTGTIKANQGASGVTTNEGSSANVLASQAEIGQLNAMTIRSNAARQAYGYETQAAIDTSAAKNAVTEGYVGAAADALKTGAATYSAFGSSTPSSVGDIGVSSPTLLNNAPQPAWDTFMNKSAAVGSGINWGI